jgi:hypothetical protein
MSSGLRATSRAKADPGNAARAPIADAERIKFRREVFINILVSSFLVAANGTGSLLSHKKNVRGPEDNCYQDAQVN